MKFKDFQKIYFDLQFDVFTSIAFKVCKNSLKLIEKRKYFEMKESFEMNSNICVYIMLFVHVFQFVKYCPLSADDEYSYEPQLTIRQKV